MPKILVISQTHHLLPLAWRLKQEGNEVDVIVARDSFEPAWTGKFEKLLRGRKKRESQAAVAETAREAEAIVLTDSTDWAKHFKGYERLFAMSANEPARTLPSIQLGAWFDGEGFMGPHLLIEDQGLWAEGLGPAVSGGMTMVVPQEIPEAWLRALGGLGDPLKSEGFRGLVRAGISLDPKEPIDNEPELLGYQAGWNFLQMHAFSGLLDAPNLTQLLEGFQPDLYLRFTVALPVTIAPWPLRGLRSEVSCNLNAKQVPIGLDAVRTGQVFLHDMMVRDGQIQTAGLDGLVAVVRWSGQGFGLARHRALETARKLQLPEAQYRLDVGAQVPTVLMMLEELGLTL